jgi:hypothetical protein
MDGSQVILGQKLTLKNKRSDDFFFSVVPIMNDKVQFLDRHHA